MYVYWLLLLAAILSEVMATTSMKLSAGFTKAIPSAMMMVGYMCSGIFITLAIKRIELSIAYAVWRAWALFCRPLLGYGFVAKP
ncbi:MAG: SMR family transporter [Paracoccaceae bacterium]